MSGWIKFLMECYYGFFRRLVALTGYRPGRINFLARISWVVFVTTLDTSVKTGQREFI